MIIGLAGPARSGKDTVAGIVKEFYDGRAEQYNLADPLKACVNDWLNWGQAHGYGDQKETPQALKPNFESLVGYVIKHFGDHCTPDQAVRVMEQMKEEFEAYRFRPVHHMRQFIGTTLEQTNDVFVVSPRQVYQWFGTEGMRSHVDNDFWLKLIPDEEITILADVRFENEAQYVRNTGGMIIHISRPDCQEVTAHSSEAGLELMIGDYEIVNDGTIEDLRAKVWGILPNEL